MRLRTRSLALALVSLLVCSTAQARARPRSGAAQAFLRGKRLFDRGDFTAAVAAFEEAYRLKPHHAVQCSIALCYEQMNRFVEAAEHYRRCLAGGAAKTGKAREVRRSLAGVEARINWVNVRSPAPGGTVHVDGVALGPAPRRVPLNPGRHMLEVRRHGAWPATIVLQLLSGEERTVTLAPVAKDERPAPASAPTVALREEVTPREPPADRPDRPSRRRLSPAWFWTSAALTVALAGAAATMGGLTYKAHEDYYDRPTREGYDTFIQRRLVTNILAGLAVAAGATGTVLFFYTDFSGRRNEQVSAGIGLRGTF